jgi:hypothetical protein
MLTQERQFGSYVVVIVAMARRTTAKRAMVTVAAWG